MASSNQASRIRDSVRVTLLLYVRDVRDPKARRRRLTVRSWSTIKDVKDELSRCLHVPASALRLYFGPVLDAGKELPNRRSLHDVGIHRDGETLLLDIRGGGEADASLRVSPTAPWEHVPKSLRRVVQQARRGMALGLKPAAATDGSGGAYFLHDARKRRVAVFKPADEEPYAEFNPRGYTARPDDPDACLREGVRPGEACVREVAAWLLDARDGFSDVPPTTLAEARHVAFRNVAADGVSLLAGGNAGLGSHVLHPIATVKPRQKVGSLQEYVYAEDTMDDLSPTKLSTDQVHKIVILDIRIMNADRNAANLLVRRRQNNSLELIPIDHGFCLRSVCDVSWFDWCWLDWPQLKQPLSDRSRDYVLRLDIEADVKLLQENLRIDHEALDHLRISTRVLQAGVSAGLTLYEVAVLCCRNDNAGLVPSRLEILIQRAQELTTAAIENNKWGHAAASRALQDQLLPTPVVANGRHSSDDEHDNNDDDRINGRSTHDESNDCAALNDEVDNNKENQDAHQEFGFFDLEDDDDDNEEEPLPRRVSTAREECDEWAANVLASGFGPTVETATATAAARSESLLGSSESSDGSSVYDGGFWRVRPGDNDDDDDDDDINRRCDSPASWSTRTPVRLESLERDEGDDYGPTRPRSVRLLETDSASFMPPRREPSPSPTPTPALFMSRSKSYSAFSFRARESDVGVNRCESSQLRQTVVSRNDHHRWRAADETTEKQFREYFLKFADLLIAREIMASDRRRGVSSKSS